MDEEESFLSNILEEEEEENSDEKAMRQFLDELKKYRKKYKLKSNEIQPKSTKSGKKASSSEGKKKKRKRRKLFDPHPPPKTDPKDEQKNDEPKKTITRKEYDSLMKRLIKINNDQNPKNKNQNPKNKNQNSKNKNQNSPKKDELQQDVPKIFTDLYDQSLQAKQKRDEMIDAQNKIDNLKNRPKPEAWRQTKVYAHNRMVQFVKDTFGKNTICYEKKLLDMLYTLGLVEYKVLKPLPNLSDPYQNSFDDEEEEEHTEVKDKQVDQSNEDEIQNFTVTFEDGKACKADKLLRILQKLDMIKITKEPEPTPELTDESSEIQIEEDEEEDSEARKRPFYEISNLIKFYLEVARDQISTKFHQIVKEKLLIAMANGKKKQEPKQDQIIQSSTALTLTRATLERLAPPRQQQSPEKENIMIQNESEEYQPVKLSEGSKKILSESTRKADDDKLLCALPIDQREKHLLKMKNDKIEQMKQEFQAQLTQNREFSNQASQFEFTRKVDDDILLSALPIEEREKQLNKIKKEKIEQMKQSFQDQLIKDKVLPNPMPQYNEVENPQGWDEDISRHRKAYDDFIHLKRLKNEGFDYIMECRHNSRAQRKQAANQNADSNANKSQNVAQLTDTNRSNSVRIETSSPSKKTKIKNQDNVEEHVKINIEHNESEDADMED